MNKTCLSCHVELPTTSFKKCKVNVDGLQHYCVACSSRFPESDLRWLGDKPCPCCETTKARTGFYGRSNRAGLSSKCKPCESAHICKWIQDLPEEKRSLRAKKCASYKRLPASKARFRECPKYVEGNTRRARKQIDSISDSYLKRVLRKSPNPEYNQVLLSEDLPQVLQLKRLIISIKRAIKVKR